MVKQTSSEVWQNQVKGQVFNVLPNIWLLGHGDLYMTELLGRVPTIPILIFNGIQKFRLASSSVQVFIQMIAPLGLTLSVKVNLTKSTNS